MKNILGLFLVASVAVLPASKEEGPALPQELQWPGPVVESEVMPAETIPTTLGLAEGVDEIGLPRRGPWVNPDDAGASSPYAQVLVSQWGWGIGAGGLPLVLSDYMLGASAQTNAVTNTMYSGAGGPVSWSETRIHGIPDSQIKWGTRAFAVLNWIFRRCGWDTISKEHGFYGDADGAIEFNECSFGGEGDEEITGQAVQLVYSYPGTKREHETTLPAHTWLRLFNATVNTDWHKVIRCAIVNVGKPHKSERASFALSFFEPSDQNGPVGHPVLVQGCYMQASDPWIDQNGVVRDCTGAIMVHKRKQAIVRQNYIEYRKGDRDVIQIWACGDGIAGTPDVIITENVIGAAQAIDIRLGNDNDTVVIQRNRGTCEVVISSPRQPWYVWTHGWLEEEVLYRGPINQNYRHN